MERLRLWRYKKLANENVREEKAVTGKQSDDEDYNSCFKLKKSLKNSCKRIITKHRTAAKKTTDDSSSAKTEEKFIKKLKEQQRSHNQEADDSRKTLQKCLHKILSRSRNHQLLSETVQEEKAADAYVTSGIYDRFGNSCTESLKKHEPAKASDVEAEDLSAASWYYSGITAKFSVEILKHQSPGSFIIHKASLKSGNFILSLRVHSTAPKVVHHLIVQSKHGYRLKGATKMFSTVTSLVTHHSVMAEQLPLALTLRRTYNNDKKCSDNDDFSTIEDLGKVFTDLELDFL